MDPLKVLELHPGYTREDVKKNFRRLSFLYHPDKNPHNKESEEHFKDIVNAYELLNKNTYDTKKVPAGYCSVDTIYSELEITIEDIYFERDKTISIKRNVLCPTCSGLGTENDINGVCDLCKGTGKIDNKLLHILKKQNIYVCPYCNGIGIKKEYICLDCKGKKIKEEIKEYKFKLNFENFNNSCFILSEKGNQYPNGTIGDVLVRLKINKSTLYRIEKGMLRTDIYVTYTQRLIGDTYEIEVFGKKFKFVVTELIDKIILIDKRKEFSHPRSIIVHIHEIKPVLNKETIKLYKKILSIEKKVTSLS